LLEFGKHRLDVEVLFGFARLGGGLLRLRDRRSGHGGRQQRGTTVAGVCRLLLGGAMHFQIQIEL
jgi:hypothetical protein